MIALAFFEVGVRLCGQYEPSQLESLENQIIAQISMSSDNLSSDNLSSDKYVVDLSDVQGSDSGLVALLLSCRRQAAESSLVISFINPSQKLRGLVHLSNLDKLIPFED